MSLRVFPVAFVSGVHYTDDFGAPRTGGRAHQGNDIFVPEGTPALAPDDGTVRFTIDPIGGRSYYVKAEDGVTYYGTHLSATEGASGRHVRAGETIGYVGHDGNAQGTPDHLHFEMHVPGQGAIDPFPYLASAERRSSTPTPLWPWALILSSAAGLSYVYRNELENALRRFIRWP